MSSRMHPSLSNFLEDFAGTFGALFLGMGFASAIAILVPGSHQMRDILAICALGLVLLLSSFLVFRNRTLFVGRVAQAFLFTAAFAVLFLLPSIVKRPSDVRAWLIILTSIGIGYRTYRVLGRTRAYFHAHPL